MRYVVVCMVVGLLALTSVSAMQQRNNREAYASASKDHAVFLAFNSLYADHLLHVVGHSRWVHSDIHDFFKRPFRAVIKQHPEIICYIFGKNKQQRALSPHT